MLSLNPVYSCWKKWDEKEAEPSLFPSPLPPLCIVPVETEEFLMTNNHDSFSVFFSCYKFSTVLLDCILD